MKFNDIAEIKKAGFVGFKTIRELLADSSGITKQMGVYLILNLEKHSPHFLPVGTGGYFKGKDPNVSIAELKANWVEGAMVVYVGKAGKTGGSATLYSRLRQYLRFGQGANVGHYGGRLIWQLKLSGSLVVCWKPLQAEDPRTVEAELIRQFDLLYAKRPFANLVG